MQKKKKKSCKNRHRSHNKENVDYCILKYQETKKIARNKKEINAWQMSDLYIDNNIKYAKKYSKNGNQLLSQCLNNYLQTTNNINNANVNKYENNFENNDILFEKEHKQNDIFICDFINVNVTSNNHIYYDSDTLQSDQNEIENEMLEFVMQQSLLETCEYSANLRKKHRKKIAKKNKIVNNDKNNQNMFKKYWKIAQTYDKNIYSNIAIFNKNIENRKKQKKLNLKNMKHQRKFCVSNVPKQPLSMSTKMLCNINVNVTFNLKHTKHGYKWFPG